MLSRTLLPLLLLAVCPSLLAEEFKLVDPTTKKAIGTMKYLDADTVEINGKLLKIERVEATEPLTLKKAKAIMIANLDLKDVPLKEVVEILKTKSKENDPEAKADPAKAGLNIVSISPRPQPGSGFGILQTIGEPQITAALQNVSFADALQYIASLAERKVIYEDHTVKIVSAKEK